MPETNRKGRVPTPEEFFDHCIVLADVSEKSLLDGQALRDEVARAIQTLNGLHAVYQRDLKVQSELITTSAKKLHQMYSPDCVTEASNMAKISLKSFQSEAEILLKNISEKTYSALSAFSLRIFSTFMLAAIFLAFSLFLVLQYVPSLDEIQKRRAELNQLQLRIERLTERMDTRPRQ